MTPQLVLLKFTEISIDVRTKFCNTKRAFPFTINH
jgi:hypothetical protein